MTAAACCLVLLLLLVESYLELEDSGGVGRGKVCREREAS